MSAGAKTWLDGIAVRAGFGAVADAVPLSVAPSTLAVSVLLFVDTVPLQLLKFATGQVPSFLENPFWLAIPVVVLGLLYTTRSMQQRHRQAMDLMRIDERTRDRSEFESLSKDRVRWVTFGLLSGLILVNLVVFVTIPVILRVDGVPGLVGNFVIVPFVYVPVAVDFLVTYIEIMILVPRKIAETDFQLDFLDPEGVGGLRPVGELIKFSYHHVILWLVLTALFIYGPSVFGELAQSPVEPSPLVSTGFTLAWVAGAGSLGYGLYVLHTFMKRQKREKLLKLDEQYRAVVEDPWEITENKVPDDRREEAERLRQQMERITDTKEYPATFSMWVQVALALILPKATQFLLANI